MKKSKEAPAELSLDSLDDVVGGKGTAILNGTLGLGPVSVGVSVDLQNGKTYVTGGLSSSLSIGGSVSLGVVIPYNRDTPASEVISGQSIGGEAYFGGGGGVSANGVGVIVSGGFGLGIGGGVTDTASTAPDTHSPTVSTPVYDPMGNATGFTTEVPNPNYIPPSNGTHDSSGDTTHAGDDTNHQVNDPGYEAGDANHASANSGGAPINDSSGFDGGGHSDGFDDGGGHSDGFDDGGGYSGGFDGGGYSGGFDGGDFA